MVRLPAVVRVAWPVVAGAAGLSAAVFVVYRTYARRALGAAGEETAGVEPAAGERGVGGSDEDGSDENGSDEDGRDGATAADGEAAHRGPAAGRGATVHQLRWSRYTVVPVAAVAGATLFVLAVDAYVRAATAIADGAGASGRGAAVLVAMALWGGTVLACVLAGVRGYAPLARRRDPVALADVARTAAYAAAFAGLLAGGVALLVVDPLAAAVAVAAGRPAAAAAAPRLVDAVERTRPLPAPWDRRVPEMADRVGVDLAGARVVADDEVRVSVAGLVPGYRVLLVTDRALAALDEGALAGLVVRELADARRHAAARRVAVETVPVALWLGSFRLLAPGQAVLVGVLLVAPYAAALGLVGHRAAYAADDAAAAAVGGGTVVEAIERAAVANDVPDRRDPLFDLLAARPAPRRRVERLRSADPGAVEGRDGDRATRNADG